jgi:hypothetical protein
LLAPLHSECLPGLRKDGTYTLTFPIGKAKMPGIAVEDIGKCAYGIFKKGAGFIGQKVVAGEHLSGVEMAEKCSTALDITCTFDALPPDTYRNLGFPGADDLDNMFQIFDEFEQQYRASRSVEASRMLVPSLMNFDQWLAKNKSKIPLA